MAKSDLTSVEGAMIKDHVGLRTIVPMIKIHISTSSFEQLSLLWVYYDPVLGVSNSFEHSWVFI